MALATIAIARPVTPPPHGFSRGCEPSTSATRAPRIASVRAAHEPDGPAPMTATSTSFVMSRDTLHAMVEAETERFTVGVFQDIAWAHKGVDALKQAGFPVDSLSIVIKDGPEAAAFVERSLGAAGQRIELAGIGTAVAYGSLVETLGGAQELLKHGLAGTMRRVGFQSHDGRIFDALTKKGGVLVAIKSEPRAADALAILHSYGGGNAAIGAWTGRV